MIAPLVGHMDAVDIDPEQIDTSSFVVNSHDRQFIPALRLQGSDISIPNGYYLPLLGATNVTYTPSDSLRFMREALEQGTRYDFIQIDGNHATDHVFMDSVLAYLLCEPGGLLWWDDFAKFGWDLPGITYAVQSLAAVAGETFYYPRETEWCFLKKMKSSELQVLQNARTLPFAPEWLGELSRTLS